MNLLLEIYNTEKPCNYREEDYLVRDNGAVMRLSRLGKRSRPLDNQWTFGKIDKYKGYTKIANATVHRIVATAFHGPQPSEKHVVDHIDTNRQNNRPENLRWITRFENILLNPITLSRIIYKYGSIDAFLKDPSQPLNGNLDQSFDWMRAVTQEESEKAKRNMLQWYTEGKVAKGGELGEWVFRQMNPKKTYRANTQNYSESLTPNAVQYNWDTPSEFPQCPDSDVNKGLVEYHSRLTKGVVFAANRYGKSLVEQSDVSKDHKEIYVVSASRSIKPYGLAKIYLVDNSYIHEALGMFFTLEGARKEFNLSLGREWRGEETIDDFS